MDRREEVADPHAVSGEAGSGAWTVPVMIHYPRKLRLTPAMRRKLEAVEKRLNRLQAKSARELGVLVGELEALAICIESRSKEAGRV